MDWDAIQQWFGGTRLVRRLVDAVFRGRARRRLAELDRLDAARSQALTLRGLVHRAHATRFGRDHDFGRIRTPDDFRRLVPLRTPLDFWRDYWQPSFPDLGGATWPGPVSALALRGDPLVPYLPAPSALWASHRAAALTALSFVADARPQARLFGGRMLFVDDGPPASLLSAGVQVGGAGWLGLQELKPRHRAYTLPPPSDDPTATPGGRLRSLARRAGRSSVTLAAGEARVLADFFDLCTKETGWARAADVWPRLEAVVYRRGTDDRDRLRLLSQLAGPRPIFALEAWASTEAPVAVEDPRHGCLRLLPNHGVFFEFVPAGEVGSDRPLRLGVADVEPNVPYAVAVTSPAGVWACLAGLRVAFERRDPPLLRVLGPVAVSDAPHPLQPPHPRSGDSRAARPGRAGRSLSSARAGRE